MPVSLKHRRTVNASRSELGQRNGIGSTAASSVGRGMTDPDSSTGMEHAFHGPSVGAVDGDDLSIVEFHISQKAFVALQKHAFAE